MNRNTRTLLIDQAEAALRCWHGDDMTREQATALLPSWRWVVGLDDDMRAEVLDRFPSAEPPSVAGKDWLPGAPVTSKMLPAIELARRANPGAMLTAAALNAVADADDVLGADEPFCPSCNHRMRMHSKDWGCNVWRGGKACPCVTGFAGFAPPKQTQADAAVLVAEAVAVLDEPKAEEQPDAQDNESLFESHRLADGTMPDTIPVTDPEQDAPDGATVDGYTRQRGTWVKAVPRG